MNDTTPWRIERNIAQCRVLLSIAAPLTVYLDHTDPIFIGSLTGAAFYIDPTALAVMAGLLLYSVVILVLVWRARTSLARIVGVSTWADIGWATAVALVSESVNSPFYVFFLFSVLATGLRGTFRTALKVTATSLAAYVALVVVTLPDGFGVYLSRIVYLAITGYLVGSLGRHRMVVESNLQGLTRSLHDGYVQALASVNLRLSTCRELIRRDRAADALTEITELQVGVAREYDDLRAYLRSLHGLEIRPGRTTMEEGTIFRVRCHFDASLSIVEHVLQIALEGARNVGRHAGARVAVVEVHRADEHVVIRIEDDGVGFPADATVPWSIASRAAEVGGQVRISKASAAGGHVVVELPAG